MTTVRIIYKKLDVAKYISHLDMQRCMQRAVKRAKLPVWYTEGFNPHPYITFALPISLGIESLCESFDIKLTEEIPLEKIAEEINKGCPIGVNVINVAVPVMKAKEIEFASYDISFDDEGLKDEIEKILSEKSLMTEKKTKSGIKEIDIKPYIKEYKLADNKISIVLAAGNIININPGLVTDIIEERIGRKLSNIKTVRTGIYNKDLTEFR